MIAVWNLTRASAAEIRRATNLLGRSQTQAHHQHRRRGHRGLTHTHRHCRQRHRGISVHKSERRQTCRQKTTYIFRRHCRTNHRIPHLHPSRRSLAPRLHQRTFQRQRRPCRSRHNQSCRRDCPRTRMTHLRGRRIHRLWSRNLRQGLEDEEQGSRKIAS